MSDLEIFAEARLREPRDQVFVQVICRTAMKNAALFALGLLAAGVWSHDSARSQTSRSAPLSLAPPAPLNEGAASPATTDSVPPPTTATSAPPPRAAAVSPAPSAKSNVGSSRATDDVPPPSAKPAADYDGYSVGTVDDDEASSGTTRPVRSRRAKPPTSQEADRIRPQSVDPGDDDKLKGRLTICRGCK